MRKLFVVVLALLPLTALAADDATILVPLGMFRTPGAFGSLWQTELAVRNGADQDVSIVHAGSLCTITCPFPAIELHPGAAVLLTNPFNQTLLASQSGLVMHVVSRAVVSPQLVSFNFRVRDVSRETLTWGTEIPVVRGSDFILGPVVLLNIPTDPKFRATLRVYSVDATTAFAVNVRVSDFASNTTLASHDLAIDRASDASAAYYPAYAQLDSLTADLAGPSDAVNVEITPAAGAPPMWAFVSITNNETQHVTIVTPE